MAVFRGVVNGIDWQDDEQARFFINNDAIFNDVRHPFPSLSPMTNTLELLTWRPWG